MVVPEDQLSLAIGRDGQNARLAAKLTNWRIDIKSLPEAASESLVKLRTDANFAAMLASEEQAAAKVEEYLARKADGKPLAPEEYDFMAKFVDRVEKKATAKTEEQKQAEEAQLLEFKKMVPASAFNMSILDSGLPEHVGYILQEAGYFSVGDLAVQMKLDQDQILRLQGIGARAIINIEELMVQLDAQLVAEKEAPVVEVAPVIETEVVEPEPVVEETPAEVVAEPAAAVKIEEPEVVEEEEISLEEIFSLRPEVLDTTAIASEEEEGDESDKKKAKKKKSKHVVITYDEDRDATTVTKKHKRGDDWEIEE